MWFILGVCGSVVTACVFLQVLGQIRDDPYWTFRENSLELIELSDINKVSLV